MAETTVPTGWRGRMRADRWVGFAALMLAVSSLAASPSRAQTPSKQASVAAAPQSGAGTSTTSAAANELPDPPDPKADALLPVEYPDNIGKRPNPPPGYITFHERLDRYGRSFKSPGSMIISPLAGGGIDELEGQPKGWNKDWGGFGERVGSSLARSVIARTITFGISSVDGEDVRFYPAPRDETGFVQRLIHAASETVLARTADGGTMPAYSRISGAVGAGFASDLWMPPGYRRPQDSLERASTSLAANAAANIFDEFWPDIRAKLPGHKVARPQD